MVGRELQLAGHLEAFRLGLEPAKLDATLSNDKSKDIVPAKRLEYMGGYAGLWKVIFDQQSIRGPLLNDSSAKELVFEARLNQNLDFKAKFEMEKIGAIAVATASAK